jgi:hypothetical protein
MGYTSCNLLKIDRNTWCTGAVVVDPPLRRQQKYKLQVWRHHRMTGK